MAVVVLLSIVMVLSATWIRRTVEERQQLRRYQIEKQATRLAESGLARGRARLARNAAYTGELWEIPADAWHAGRAARVQIDVKAAGGDKEHVTITVQATYPYEDERAVHRTRTARVRPQSPQQ